MPTTCGLSSARLTDDIGGGIDLAHQARVGTSMKQSGADNRPYFN
jgi:hypothetical protein